MILWPLHQRYHHNVDAPVPYHSHVDLEVSLEFSMILRIES